MRSQNAFESPFCPMALPMPPPRTGVQEIKASKEARQGREESSTIHQLVLLSSVAFKSSDAPVVSVDMVLHKNSNSRWRS